MNFTSYHSHQENRPERQPEKSLFSQEIQVERKTFLIEVCENHRGKLCRITEMGKYKDRIVLPADGISELIVVLKKAGAA